MTRLRYPGETAVTSLIGITRSVGIYHQREHIDRMVRFYRQLVKPGDLVFDIGAHVGDRTRAFRRLGCRVVAVEPQPALALLLRLLHPGSRKTRIVEAALSDGDASLKLRVNRRNPSVASASADFIKAAQAGAPGWQGQHWDGEVEVPATTLDALSARFGAPAFVKIDVEGYEDRVLTGLSQPVPALSFEFTTHQKAVAFRALDRASSLGFSSFNACLGESWMEEFNTHQTQKSLAAWLDILPAKANSGDIYCYRS